MGDVRKSNGRLKGDMVSSIRTIDRQTLWGNYYTAAPARQSRGALHAVYDLVNLANYQRKAFTT